MGTHQIPLHTFGNPEYSNYLLFKRFLRRARSSNKRWRPQTIYSRASILFIRTNAAKIQIYRQLLLATQIPRYLTVFGLPTSNIEHCQIPPNTIWELAFNLHARHAILVTQSPVLTCTSQVISCSNCYSQHQGKDNSIDIFKILHRRFCTCRKFFLKISNFQFTILKILQIF